MIILVERDKILDYWDGVNPLIESALKHSQGEFNHVDILQYLISQTMHLWVAVDNGIQGMAITQIVIYPRQRSLQVVLLAGHDAFGKWFEDMLKTIEVWAKCSGCVRVQENGRAGWEKAEERLKLGYKKIYTTMSKEL